MTPQPAVHLRLPDLAWHGSRAATIAALTVMGSLGLAACGAPAEQMGGEQVDSDAMHVLLSEDDIEEAGGSSSRLRFEVEDVLATAATVNPDHKEGILAWYAMKVKRGKGNATLIFTVQEFATSGGARQRLSTVMSGLGYAAMDTPVGDGSAMLVASAGTGVTFIKGHRLVWLQSISGDAGEPILDEDGIERLARIIESRF